MFYPHFERTSHVHCETWDLKHVMVPGLSVHEIPGHFLWNSRTFFVKISGHFCENFKVLFHQAPFISFFKRLRFKGSLTETNGDPFHQVPSSFRLSHKRRCEIQATLVKCIKVGFHVSGYHYTKYTKIQFSSDTKNILSTHDVSPGRAWSRMK